MKLIKGNMWLAFDFVDLFLITTNATTKSNGALVMGRGIAKQARDKFPGLDLKLGKAIDEFDGNNYYLLVSPDYPDKKIGCFQVKRLFNDIANLALIAGSVKALQLWCEKHPEASVALNFPGIGNGKLDRNEVLPIISKLPDQVRIYEL